MNGPQIKSPRVLVFAASTRTGSLHRKLAQAAARELERAGLAVTVAELRDYPLPIYEGDLEASAGVPRQAKAFQELLRSHDAFVIASPEYNGSFSPLLKNLIDWTSRPATGERPLAAYRGKTAALLSASPGPGGGRRGLRHLRELLEMIGVTVMPEPVSVGRALEAFDSEGKLTRSEDQSSLTALASSLATVLGNRTRAAA